MVAIDQLLQATMRAALVSTVAVAVGWWASADLLVATVLVPFVVVMVVLPLAGLGSRAWREVADRATPLVDAVLLPVLDDLRRQAGTLPPFGWYVGGGRFGLGGEGAHIARGSRAARVVLQSQLCQGPVPLVEAIAAHELGHVRTIRYGPGPAASRVIAGGAALVLLGALLHVLLGDRPVGPWELGVGLVALGPVAVVQAGRSRAGEAEADRFSAPLLADRAASAAAVRQFLVATGVDLEPRGLRRWLARYPPARVRVALLCSATGASSPSRERRRSAGCRRTFTALSAWRRSRRRTIGR